MKSINTTKHGVEVRAGQVWEDCDKRMRGRRLSVLRVENGRAYLDGYPKTSVAVGNPPAMRDRISRGTGS